MGHLPPPVRPGDPVGVAALSGPCAPQALTRGLAALKRLGFRPVVATNVGARCGLFAGADDERLAAFHHLAADPTLKAIFFTRGGHGVLRLLPRFDWRLLRAHPRAYVGYSDLTPFLLEVERRLGLVALHGPMLTTDLARGLDDEEVASLLGALAGTFPVELAVTPVQGEAPAEGRLLGGCLSLLVSTLGTPYFPDLTDSLLFLEDTNEPLFRLDRKLTHLRLSGNLAKIRGMVLGSFHRQGPDRETEEERGAWLEWIAREAQEYPWPVARDLKCGHGAPNLTLPLGLNARLDPQAGRLIVGAGRAPGLRP